MDLLGKMFLMLFDLELVTFDGRLLLELSAKSLSAVLELFGDSLKTRNTNVSNSVTVGKVLYLP